MIGRREFLMGTATAITAPHVLKIQATAQTPLQATAQTPRVRRDVQALVATDTFFTKYGQAVQAMHQLPANDPRNWRNQALIHLNHCPHNALDFFHWHRHYILNFEAICGQLIGDNSFSLAYWNWSAKQGIIPDPFYDLNLLNVQFWNDPSNAQSEHWGPETVVTVGTRALAKGQGLQSDPNAGQGFTQASIDDIQQGSDFQIFTGELEGSPHNNGHVISGEATGHMGNGMSPLDPIFWLHHCNVDRIWAEWQTAGNSTPALIGNYDNQFVNGAGQAVMASSAAALDFAAMGYTYDTLSAPVVAAAQQRFGLQEPQAQSALRAFPIAAAPTTLGVNNTAKMVVQAVETRYTVSAKDLLPNLLKPRAFWATKFPSVRRRAVGSGRILARNLGYASCQTGGAHLQGIRQLSLSLAEHAFD